MEKKKLIFLEGLRSRYMVLKNTRLGCHFLLQGNLPDSGIKPVSPALAGGFVTLLPPGKAVFSSLPPFGLSQVFDYEHIAFIMKAKDARSCHSGR